MADITLDIVTPEKAVYSGPALEVRAPGYYGEFGVLPGHATYLAVLRAGIVTVVAPGGEKRFVVGRGFAEAGAERVVILTDSCEEPSAIDKAAAQAALSEAEGVLETAAPDTEEWLVAVQQAELARARLLA